MGFTEKKEKMAGRLRPGDRLLCYLTKVSAFVGVLEVDGPSFTDHEKRMWSDGVFPVRIPVKINLELPLSEVVPIRTLAGKLSFMPEGARGAGWTIHVRSSPRRWLPEDGAAVFSALQQAGRGQDRKIEIEVPRVKAPLATGKRKKTIGNQVRVGRVIEKTKALAASEEAGLLGSYANALSQNKVTGYSVNVPIGETCRPTALCMKTCYFATGAASWSNALRHQRKIYASIGDDPAGFAERVAMEYDRLGLTFVRWNGGGDLFPESVAAVNHLGRIRPDIVIWVVTRIPEWAALIEDLPNVYIHFSLDRHSLSRREKFLSLGPKSSNYFFSYQCDKGEVPEESNLRHVSVLFFDNYVPTTSLDRYDADVVCPLNSADDIRDTCEGCRRCFDGMAVAHAREVSEVVQ